MLDVLTHLISQRAKLRINVLRERPETLKLVSFQSVAWLPLRFAPAKNE